MGEALLSAAFSSADLLLIHAVRVVPPLLTDLYAQAIGAVVSADPARVATRGRCWLPWA